VNPKERNEINAPIGEMVNRELVAKEKRSGMLVVALTQHGFDTI
jgi:hypothetical protein